MAPTPRRTPTLRFAALLAVLSCLGLPGCSDTTGPPSPLLYSVIVWHGPFTFITGRATSAVSGDTLSIQVDLTDSTTATGTPATVRGICAENIRISRGNTVVATLPAPVTCADSVYSLSIGPAFSATWISRGFLWVVPAALPSGSYTIRAETLVSPGLAASAELQIN